MDIRIFFTVYEQSIRLILSICRVGAGATDAGVKRQRGAAPWRVSSSISKMRQTDNRRTDAVSNRISLDEKIDKPSHGWLTGIYRWCSHLTNAPEATSLPFRPLPYSHTDQWVRPAWGFKLAFYYSNKKHLKNDGPIRHCEPPHAACFTLPFTGCCYCRTPPAHRCPQQHRQQRQRVTEGTAMALWNGPNHSHKMRRF